LAKRNFKLAKLLVAWYLPPSMFGEIKNQHGEQLDYSVQAGEARSDFIVIIGHGVTGNKDRPFVVALAEGLSAASIPTLCMSFAGNGDSGGTFADCTISKETDDLGSVIDAMGDRKICYIGHSMGGAVGVRRASSDSRIDALVSLAGMVHTEEFARREFGEETPDAGCMWEEESCPLSSTFMNDMAAIRSVVDLGAEISVPWLLVHGTEDDVVPIGDTHDIIAKATNSPEVFEIAGANHVFSDDALPVMVNKVTEWVGAQAG
jgi:pimeloyl-ACP methyl ester carboxylesterase